MSSRSSSLMPRRRRSASSDGTRTQYSLSTSESSPAELSAMIPSSPLSAQAIEATDDSAPPSNKSPFIALTLDHKSTHLDKPAHNEEDEMDATQALQAGLVTSETAQNWFPPEACLFVANLRISVADHHLRRAVQEAFSCFGQCFVKIRRDPTKLPVAFVQYTNVTNAEKAADQGKHIAIAGLTVRIERAKCDRTLFCTTRAPNSIVPQDQESILGLLQQYGRIEDVQRLPVEEQQSRALSDGFVVRFRHYGSCQDALRGLQSHDRYQFRLFRSEPSTVHKPSVHRGSRCRRTLAPRLYSKSGSIIAVDGLPVGSNAAQLEEIFQRFGTIIKVLISQETITRGGQRMVHRYAHIHFQEPFAGWAASTFSIAYGIKIRNPGSHIFTNVNINVTYVDIRGIWYPQYPAPVPQFTAQTAPFMSASSTSTDVTGVLSRDGRTSPATRPSTGNYDSMEDHSDDASLYELTFPAGASRPIIDRISPGLPSMIKA